MDLDAEIQRVQDFIDGGNYHAAYNIALSALNECRRNSDQLGVDRMIECIRNLVDSLASEFGSPSRDQKG